MGNCSTRSLLGYEELRNSIPGSLITDHDFDLFYSLCKIETIGSISSALHPSKNQLFYVVISGQVVVHLSSSKIPNVCATTFYSGDMIHFFNSSLHTVTKHDVNCIRNGNIALSLQFKGYTEKMGRVIGMDKINFEKFLMTRYDHKQPLVTLLNINMSDLMKESRLFHTMALKQLNMLGPLLKIRLAPKGGLVCFPLRLNAEMPKNYTSGGTVAVVLFGTATSVPITQNIDAWADRLRKESPSSSSSKGSRRKPDTLVGSIARLVQGTPRAYRDSAEISLRSVRSHELGNNSTYSGGLGDSDQKPHLTLLQPPGSVLGLDAFFMRNPELIVRKHLVTSSYCVLGYIPPKILDAFCEVDPRFLRLLSRNYHRIVLNSVKFAVPMLSGLEDASYERLSHRVALKSFAAGTTIYTQGEMSEYAYIVLFGAVTISRAEREDISKEEELYEEQGSASEGVRESLGQILTWSSVFGDVAVVTNSPYFNTAIAIEPTAVLAISKTALEEVYYENKTKLCEIRIRQVGKNVELQHIIDHPRGSEAFKKFLIKAMAVESLLFYIAVDRFDSMCITVSKMFMEIRKYRNKIEKNLLLINEHQQQTLSDEIPTSVCGRQVEYKRVSSPMFANRAVGSTCTAESLISMDSQSQSQIEVDNQRNSQYMARLFVELDSHVGLQGPSQSHPQTFTPLSPAEDSYESDAETDIGEASSVAPTDTAALLPRHRRHSHSAVSVNSINEEESDPIPPTHPLNTMESIKLSQDTVHMDDHTAAILPLRNKPSPSGTAQVITEKSSLLPHNITLGTLHISSSSQPATQAAIDEPQCRTQHALEQQRLAALMESNQHLHDPAPVPTIPIKTLIEQNTELCGKVHRRMGKLRQSIIELREVARQIMETYVHVNSPNQVNISSKTRTKMEQMFHKWSLSSYSINRLLKRSNTKNSGINTITETGTGAGIEMERGLDTISSVNTRASGSVAPFTEKINNQILSATPSPIIPAATTTCDASIIGSNSNNMNPITTTITTTSTDQQQQPPPPHSEELDKLNLDFTTLFHEAKIEVLKLLKQDNFPRWQRTTEFAQFIETMIQKDTLPAQAKKDEEIIQAKEYSSMLTTVGLKRNISVESCSVSWRERKSVTHTAPSTHATKSVSTAVPAGASSTSSTVLNALVSRSPSLLSFAFGSAGRSNKVEPGSVGPCHDSTGNTVAAAGPGTSSGIVTAFTPPPPERFSK